MIITKITDLNFLTTWQVLDYMVFGELSNEQPIESFEAMDIAKRYVMSYKNGETWPRKRNYCEFDKTLKELFPDNYKRIAYIQKLIVEQILSGKLPIYYPNNGEEKIKQGNGMLSVGFQIDWDNSRIFAQFGKDVDAALCTICFQTKDIVNLNKKDETLDNSKQKDVKEMARQLFDRGICNQTELIQAIHENLSTKYSRGLSNKQILNDIKLIKPPLKLIVSPRGRPKKKTTQ